MDLEGELKQSGITIVGGIPEQLEALDPNGDGLRLVAALHDELGESHGALLAERDARYEQFDNGMHPDFLTETQPIRENLDWKVAEIPSDLEYRWAELTGPANTENFVYGALTSGANTWMADFEDALSPTFANIIGSLFYLKKAVSRDLVTTKGEITEDTTDLAVLITRSRGLHLDEGHMLVDGFPVPATLFDLGMRHSILTPEQMRRGETPADYIPKLEDHTESAFISHALDLIRAQSDIPPGLIKTSILIENIFATFQVAEILYAMKDYAIAANVGRWDQTASWYQAFRAHPDMALPDRNSIVMTLPYMMAYQKEVLRVCYEHGAQPMGGMEGNVPTRAEREADRGAYDQRIAAVMADAAREANLGFIGKWSSHPATVGLIKGQFEESMSGKPLQSYNFSDEPNSTQAQLLEVPQGEKTYEGLVDAAVEALGYNAFWLSGNGAVAIKGKMTDLATTEIGRMELRHRNAHETQLTDGNGKVDRNMTYRVLNAALTQAPNVQGLEKLTSKQLEAGSRLLRDSIFQEPRYVPDLGYSLLLR